MLWTILGFVGLSAASSFLSLLRVFFELIWEPFEKFCGAHDSAVVSQQRLERVTVGVGGPRDLWMGWGAGSGTGNGLDRDLPYEHRFTEGGGRKRLCGCK